MNLSAVEVNLSTRNLVIEAAREAENIPQQGASGRDIINVEAWVGEESGIVDVVPDCAFGCVGVVGWSRELSGRRESEVLLHIVVVATRLGTLVDVIGESLVENEETIPLVHELGSRNFIGDNIVVDTGIVDHYALCVEVGGVILVQHGIGNVRHVATGIRLASNVNLAVLQTEGVDKVLEETKELLGNLVFVGGSRCTLRKASANRLLNPDHVGQVGPIPWVVNGAGARAILP